MLINSLIQESLFLWLPIFHLPLALDLPHFIGEVVPLFPVDFLLVPLSDALRLILTFITLDLFNAADLVLLFLPFKLFLPQFLNDVVLFALVGVFIGDLVYVHFVVLNKVIDFLAKDLLDSRQSKQAERVGYLSDVQLGEGEDKT